MSRVPVIDTDDMQRRIAEKDAEVNAFHAGRKLEDFRERYKAQNPRGVRCGEYTFVFLFKDYYVYVFRHDEFAYVDGRNAIRTLVRHATDIGELGLQPAFGVP